ncbi:hypothetical protein TNIN_107871 [Trichonephila inaurata madagascariensis]|uniref:Uncharacterized protein n=1 Tax=Trichonephila inaurata madagascariensis TaxID=2747483 RepID=A0A8X6YKU6_9ARAC|nr:hypothetical protein TNIN_107871 [Trichonephila inaurata madagascariensis]
MDTQRSPSETGSPLEDLCRALTERRSEVPQREGCSLPSAHRGGKEVSSPQLATFQFTAKCRHKTAPPSLPGSTITQSGSGGGGEEKEIFPVIGRWRKHSFPINSGQQMIPKRQRSIPFGSSQSH